MIDFIVNGNVSEYWRVQSCGLNGGKESIALEWIDKYRCEECRETYRKTRQFSRHIQRHCGE